ncbi:hypothetical protein RUND412_004662 [Rhizina undulata]
MSRGQIVRRQWIFDSFQPKEDAFLNAEGSGATTEQYLRFRETRLRMLSVLDRVEGVGGQKTLLEDDHQVKSPRISLAGGGGEEVSEEPSKVPYHGKMLGCPRCNRETPSSQHTPFSRIANRWVSTKVEGLTGKRPSYDITRIRPGAVSLTFSILHLQTQNLIAFIPEQKFVFPSFTMDKLIYNDRRIVKIGTELHTCLARYVWFINARQAEHYPPEAIPELRKELQDALNEFRRCCIIPDKSSSGDVREKGVGDVCSSAPDRGYKVKDRNFSKCWECGTSREIIEARNKEKEKEERQHMNDENGIHGISLSVALEDQATLVPDMRTEEKDVAFNAQQGRDQVPRVISTHVITLNAVDIGLVPQSGQETISYHIKISVLEGSAGNQ